MESKHPHRDEKQIESYGLAECCYTDERGWVLFPWEVTKAPIDTATLHIVNIMPGATRGDHYHPRAAEWLCPIEGEGLLKWRSGSDSDVQELCLEAHRICVKIHPGIRHAVTNIGGGELLLVAAREKDPKGDVTVPEKVESVRGEER